MTATGDSLKSDDLFAMVAARIGKAGPIPFSDFMEMALYEPGLGYYVSGNEKWGKGGDYITTLDVSPVFARMIAGQIFEMWQLLGSPAQFHLVEAGAGRGWLTREILKTLSGYDPAMASGLSVHLVEKNTAYHGEWDRWKEEGVLSSSLHWHEDITTIKGSFVGCIYTNELFDAMPFHRVVVRDGVLREIYTGLNAEETSLVDIEGELSTPALSGYFKELDLELAEGQSTEVNLNMAGWVEASSRLLSEGFIITVDYGMPAWRLYERGRSGTLMCHFRHTLNDDPYLNLGRQDMTAHVDFTTLMSTGRKHGLETLGYTTQRCFMMGLGVLEELAELTEEKGAVGEAEAIMNNQGIKELIMPGGIGDTMKVLIQHKTASPRTVNLKGFSFKDMTKTLS